MREGMINLVDKDIIQIMDRRVERRMEVKFSDDYIVNRVLLFKGMRDYLMFECNRQEHLDINRYKKTVVRERHRFRKRIGEMEDCCPGATGGMNSVFRIEEMVGRN